LGRSPCKHQAVVAIKYHSGTIAEDPTFYASLRALIVSGFSHNNEINHQNMNTLNVDKQNTEVIIESSQN
ncbi:20461_t:CDS:2, partial [Racocetra persica]